MILRSTTRRRGDSAKPLWRSGTAWKTLPVAVTPDEPLVPAGEAPRSECLNGDGGGASNAEERFKRFGRSRNFVSTGRQNQGEGSLMWATAIWLSDPPGRLVSGAVPSYLVWHWTNSVTCKYPPIAHSWYCS